MIRRIASLTAALIVSVVLAVPAEAATETYQQYSQLHRNSSGAYYDNAGYRSGGWNWGPGGSGWRGISWNDPSYREWFATSEDGQWIVLDGWRSHGDYYTLRTTGEWYGRYDCTGMVPFKLGKDEGRQHYVKVDVAGQRCLIAEGEITEASTGRIVEFRHEQRWSSPFRCTSRYYTNRRCIAQLERWYDNNGHPFQLVEDRIVYLAKGLGMAFWVKDNRVNWRVSGKDYR